MNGSNVLKVQKALSKLNITEKIYNLELKIMSFESELIGLKMFSA